MVDVLFSASGLVFMTLLIIKSIIHGTLDDAMGYDTVLSPGSGWVYLMPYDKEVDPHLVQRKNFCNKIQKVMIYALVATIIFVIIRAAVK